MSDRGKPDPLSIIAKFNAEEKRLAEEVFLAPVLAGGRVAVRIRGVVYEMTSDPNFQGWALLQMEGAGRARVVERASPVLVTKYLRLFPRVHLVVLDKFGDSWWALPASLSDSRIKISGPVPVQLAENVASFDTVDSRFDGSNFWFDCIDRRRDPTISRQLRAAVEAGTAVSDLRCKGMVPQESLVYKMLYMRKYKEKEQPTDDRTRISESLRHAGAALDGYWYENDRNNVRIRFIVDGQSHTVYVSRTDLTVLSAGICLAGGEEDFDLTSLVGVFREYARRY